MKKVSTQARLLWLGILILLAAPISVYSQKADQKTVIAHRGASGYLPEHTLAAKAMAHALGADLIEQDLVMTKDDKIVVLHDHHLDRVTNVQEIFPDRRRKDGRYYAIDFTLKEIQSLFASERYRIKGAKKAAVYPNRFPLGKSRFTVHTFEEEIELIQGLNKSTGKNVGLYPEIKRPDFHLREGKDISKAVVQVLKNYGYTKRSKKLFLQIFDFDEVRRIHDVLLPSMNMDLNIVFLVNGKSEYKWVSNAAGMKEIAKYADGIGPSMDLIVARDSQPDNPRISSFVRLAHDAGLVVHPYTFRIEEDAMPGYARNFDDLLDIFFYQAEADGVFTDFPDRVVEFLKRK